MRSTGRFSLADIEPYYDRAETSSGSRRPTTAAMPANNNYKVFANGAQRVGYTSLHSGRYGSPVPRDGRPASIQDGFTFQGDKNQSKWSTLYVDAQGGKDGGSTSPRVHVIRIEHETTASSWA